ncbi:MAG: CDP-glycerol glycerophosphotransferase family protein [Lachnospiraceae bacterium]|nr:CDP-glycerol glycerophosphotransferase family protein [Lachnospiraceae bacterium]MDE6627002.1 CDP-glycerol glycerophosphotransferase family protein [Lachnospiraceae bacterium]
MIRRICKWVVFKWVYPVCYYAGSPRKIKKKRIILVENHGEQLSDDYILIYEHLKRENCDVRIHYLGLSIFSWGKIVFRTIKLIWDMTAASCVLINDSNSVFGAFNLREETRLIQLWHACGAFKKWGYSVVDKTFGEDQKALDTYSGHRNYNLVPVSGKAVCWAYVEAFGLQDKPDIVKPLGVSRTDVYFTESKKQEAHSHLMNLGFPIKGRKVILYAPTFRGDTIRGAKAPDQLDLSVLYSLHQEYVVLIKNHPFVRERTEIPESFRDFCMEIGDRMSIEELLMVADICITDYSSIVFEYSLLQKPMLFFAYDLEDYYDERGFYYPYEEFVPGPIVRTTEELLREIRQIEQFDRDRIVAFCKEYMSGCDGHSTQRIVGYVLNAE